MRRYLYRLKRTARTAPDHRKAPDARRTDRKARQATNHKGLPMPLALADTYDPSESRGDDPMSFFTDQFDRQCRAYLDGDLTVMELAEAGALTCVPGEMHDNCLAPDLGVHAPDCPSDPKFKFIDWDYPHNPASYTCPGEGIKCLCWDIENG